MHNCDEWELCKENIQPLRQGRKMEILESALKSVSDGQQEQQLQHRMNLEKQKMEFESELRSYKGDDPLEPWISYIDWTEQHFPKGGMEGSLMHLIEKCISEFMELPKYKNDERFIDICLKLTNMADDSLEMFNFMYGKEMGRSVASFYTSWALALEAAGNIKKADNVFLKGIEKGAEPKAALEMRYREFLARIMKRLQLQEDENADDDDRRLPMSSLKTYGNKKMVGTTRIGSVTSNSDQGMTRNPVPNLRKGATFVVCHDENDSEQLCVSEAVGGAVGIPMQNTESRKENEKKPGKWSNVKMKPKVTLPVAPPSSKFDVHADEASPGLVQETPIKKDVSLNPFFPLSVKKEQKRGSAFQKTSNQHLVLKGNEFLMYRSDLIYRGLQEFQFEEIRAATYNRKQKERENERLQREQCEKLRMMEEKMASMQREQKRLLDFVINFFKSSGKPANVKTIGDLFKMMGQEVTEQEVQDVTKKYNKTLLEEDVNVDEIEKPKVENDLNTTGPSRKLLTASSINEGHVSPTIHMKEAMKIAIDIFNMEDKTSRIALDSIPKTNQREDSSAEVQPTTTKRSPIVVFEDPIEDNRQPSSMQPPMAPFIVYEDVARYDDDVENCQNVPPSDYVQINDRRKLAGFLEPSLSVPFKPLTEDPDPESEDEHGIDGIQPISQPDCSSFIMPTNTMFFTNNAKVVSTPIAAYISNTLSSSLHETSKIAEKESTHHEVSSNDDKLEHPKLHEETEKVKVQELASFPRQSLVPLVGETKYLSLSTIVETSRDYKSSSSGSSGTSSAATSHFRSTPFKNKTHGEISTVLDKSEKSKETVNPFDLTVINGFLNRLGASAVIRDDVVRSNCKIPRIAPNTLVTLVGCNYMISSKVGSGGYASVFKATRIVCDAENEPESMAEDRLALKVQKPACPWEFYICDTLRNRLKLSDFDVDVTPSIMKISRMYLFENGSIIETDFHDKGTLLDLVNMYGKKNETMPEILVLYFTVEILQIVEKIHSCQIIHADIKPDNFMFLSPPSISPQASKTGSLKLIDYGRSIDMSLFPNGTDFTVKVETSEFECIEMKERRPWTYQTDLYGVAACAHVMLFGQYMQSVKQADGTWKITSTIRRYWNSAAWHSFFHRLLNIPSSDQLPNLTELRTSLARGISNDAKVLSQAYSAMMKELQKNI